MDGVSSSNPQPLWLDYVGNNQYEVTVEGETKRLSSDELTRSGQLPAGLIATPTGFGGDGFELNSEAADIALNIGGDPALPNVDGPAMDAKELVAKIGWLQEMECVSLMWLAMSTMARLAQQERRDATDIKNAFQSSKIQAQEAHIKATEEKIEAQKEAALTNFIVSLAAVAASGTLGLVGAGAQNAWQGAAFGSSQAVGGAINAGGQWGNIQFGAQGEVHAKELEAMRWKMMEEMMDHVIEESKANVEGARDQFKRTLQLLQEYAERQTQVVQKITG